MSTVLKEAARSKFLAYFGNTFGVSYLNIVNNQTTSVAHSSSCLSLVSLLTFAEMWYGYDCDCFLVTFIWRAALTLSSGAGHCMDFDYCAVAL